MTLVVDASVAVKWVTPEAGSTAAAALRGRDNHLIAPTLVIAEIGNALYKKASRGEIDKREAISALRLAVSHFTEFIPLDEFRELALELAIDLRHPIYDCFYLALAERERCALITTDAKLIAAAKRAKGIELRAL
jgi:predicted nucleic acid-binding protein